LKKKKIGIEIEGRSLTSLPLTLFAGLSRELKVFSDAHNFLNNNCRLCTYYRDALWNKPPVRSEQFKVQTEENGVLFNEAVNSCDYMAGVATRRLECQLANIAVKK
jgi:hypothetical protein